MTLDKFESTDKYNAPDESTAYEFIDEQKQDAVASGYTIKKVSCDRKVKKVKGEVVDEYYVVVITKSYEVD